MTASVPSVDVTPSASVRLHDLDALRAFAMLLGIALHASLSFSTLTASCLWGVSFASCA